MRESSGKGFLRYDVAELSSERRLVEISVCALAPAVKKLRHVAGHCNAIYGLLVGSPTNTGYCCISSKAPAVTLASTTLSYAFKGFCLQMSLGQQQVPARMHLKSC